MFYCGIDIAKYKHEATVIDGAGAALLDSISFANSKEGCEKLLALFQRRDQGAIPRSCWHCYSVWRSQKMTCSSVWRPPATTG